MPETNELPAVEMGSELAGPHTHNDHETHTTDDNATTHPTTHPTHTAERSLSLETHEAHTINADDNANENGNANAIGNDNGNATDHGNATDNASATATAMAATDSSGYERDISTASAQDGAPVPGLQSHL